MRPINSIRTLASLAVVSMVGMNVLHAERQVQVWVYPQNEGFNPRVEPAVDQDVTVQTGITSWRVSYPYGMHFVYTPGHSMHGIGSFGEGIFSSPLEPKPKSIPNATIAAVQNQGFVLTSTTNGLSVDMLQTLRDFIFAERHKISGVMGDEIARHGNAGIGYGRFTQQMSQLNQDLDAVNSIPMADQPQDVLVLPNHTIVLFTGLHPMTMGDDGGGFTGFQPYQNVVLLKLSEELFNDLWKLVK